MIASQRHLFEIPDDIAYLNCAYMSPLMKPVVAASSIGLQRKATPWTVTPQDFFTESERARGLFGRLIGAPADDVAIVPSASYGIATAAANLPVSAGQEILVLRDQFPSNVYSWRDLAAEQFDPTACCFLDEIIRCRPELRRCDAAQGLVMTIAALLALLTSSARVADLGDGQVPEDPLTKLISFCAAGIAACDPAAHPPS